MNRRRWGKRVLYLLGGYVALCCVAAIVMWAGGANYALLHGTTDSINPGNARQEFVPFRGGQLEMLIARSPGCAGREPEAFDLELLGNGSRAEDVADPVAQRWGNRPVEVWALNYPGFGQSTGPVRMKSLPAAGLAAYDAVARAAGDRPILLGSHSMGTTVALYVATQRKVAGIVLLNPPALRPLIFGHYGWWNLWLGAIATAAYVPPELNSVANAEKLSHVPAVFLSGANDHVVPPRFHRMVFNAYAGPKRLIVLPHAGHNYFPDPRTANDYKLALDWLWPEQHPHAAAIGEKIAPATQSSHANP